MVYTYDECGLIFEVDVNTVGDCLNRGQVRVIKPILGLSISFSFHEQLDILPNIKGRHTKQDCMLILKLLQPYFNTRSLIRTNKEELSC